MQPSYDTRFTRITTSFNYRTDKNTMTTNEKRVEKLKLHQSITSLSDIITEKI